MSGVTISIPSTTSRAPVTSTTAVNVSYWGSFGGLRIVSGMLAIPYYGAWVADLVFALDKPLPTTQSALNLGNLSLSGTVHRQTTFAGRTEGRIVGGADGWSRPVGAQHYANPGGVLKSMVIGDAARAVGETAVVASDAALGNFYVRCADKASRVLRMVAGPLWWIDAAGVTQVGPRTPPPVTSAFVTEELDGPAGILRVATEDPASWIPGATFSSATVPTRTIRSVRHTFDGHGKARIEVLA